MFSTSCKYADKQEKGQISPNCPTKTKKNVKIRRFWSLCLCVIQHPPQPAVWNLLPSCGSWWEEGVGVRLEQVSERHWRLGKEPAPRSSGLHQGDLAAQQVNRQVTLKLPCTYCDTPVTRWIQSNHVFYSRWSRPYLTDTWSTLWTLSRQVLWMSRLRLST